MILTEKRTYNGDDIHQRFAYKFLRKNVNPIGDVVIFRGPMDVTTNLIDQEDLLNNDYIWSDDAINIIWEIPNLCPLGAVAFQRLFNTQIASLLTAACNVPISVDGDDLMFDCNGEKWSSEDNEPLKKGSVSITVSKNNVALGHTGINIIAGKKAPSFAYSTNLDDKKVNMLIQDIEQVFYSLLEDMFIATTKVI